ncbi:Sister chromatid cohesion protein 2 [Steccherinum ochraceum]|uniref:Sister chromatid cohesion protein n=1 Tax=Steccherinum ochraceum TaxID=92696 RepID=A0A4R0RAR8_9APHY|nr:Sister chromatid cohesion protein 2 [Steccherinum ochraceum]
MQQPKTPHRPVHVVPKESPDPLAFSSPVLSVTPRKRKALPPPDLTSAKRVHSNLNQSPAPSPFGTPKTRDNGKQPMNVTPTPKQKLQVYVELPPVPKSHRTPMSSQAHARRISADDDDLGGYGSDEGHHSNMRSSGRATGDRDDRVPLDKLVTLIEDIFEAEDSLAPDLAVSELPTEFFSPLTTDASRPLLHPSIMRKLTSYVGKVTRPTKRLRLSSRDKNGVPSTPKSSSRVSQLEIPTLSRILRILDRSVKAGEDVDPFRTSLGTVEGNGSLGSPVKARKSGSKQQKARPGDGDVEMEISPEPSDTSPIDYDGLTKALDVARDSVLAADCCIAILSSDRLPKQLYSEELITTCFATIKSQLNKIVYPFVEASTDIYGHSPPPLQYLTRTSSHECDRHRRQLTELFQAVTSVIPRVDTLICSEYAAMSEGIIIQAVYIAVGPFFMAESGDKKDKKGDVVLNTLGASSMRGLRLDALSLIRSIFANHEDQRAWIIEEILSSLIKLSNTKQKSGQFRLRDGRSIRTVSALLLQLVQTSARDVRIEAGSLHKSRQHANTLRVKEGYGDNMEGTFLEETDMAEIRLYNAGLESATKAAKTIIIFLTQRLGKTKSTKDSNEAEYRAIFDALISDLLTVLFWPEWPAASVLLSLACKYMVASMDDVKTSNTNENNAAKTMALDHLGLIAARLRTTTLKFTESSATLLSLDDNTDTKAFSALTSAHKAVDSHLLKRASEDQACASARELATVIWGQELGAALKLCGNRMEDGDSSQSTVAVDQKKLLSLGSKIKNELQGLWTDASTDVFDIGSSSDDSVDVDVLSEEIGMIQSLRNMFFPILNVVLSALEAPPVFVRTKALRALGQIITSDPSTLSAPNVRNAIEGHLLDSSPQVRDAAVELIGKYMIDSPNFAELYFTKIAERIADTGLSVRKRVIKLLKAFYPITKDRQHHIDICSRLVFRMFDEDDTVKDLAIKAVEELWFHDAYSTSAAKKVGSHAQDKSALLSKVAVIMGVSAIFKDRQSPLEDLLHQIMTGKSADETSSLHQRYAEICEVLIDGLVDAAELPGFTVVNCVRTIHLFTVAHPAVLSSTHASTLLPYLKNATTHEEQVISDYLLRIFRASIPQFPKTSVKFGQDLQLALQPMVLKPSHAAGVAGLQETVACMCAIVQHLTHDFPRLVALLRSCNTRLQQTIKKPSTERPSTAESRALTILIFIAALLCEHCNFDKLRLENEALRVDIDTITKTSITEHVYRSLVSLYEKFSESGLRGRILQCLGFLFRAQPTLLTAESSAAIMDAIFISDEEDGRSRLLRIMQDFLLSEADKHSAEQKDKGKLSAAVNGDVDMQELVGNTDGFADSGVSSAVVQRYIRYILNDALSRNEKIQSAAVDILSFTVKQGLAHPLELFPVIIALETNPSPALSSRASALHAILHGKHTTLLNARFVLSARASFDYQKSISPTNIQGYRMTPSPTALLQRWYSLVRDKRVPRQDFLKALVKVFDVEISSTSMDDVAFARYMAENFATFDYKTQEEVLTVIKYLTAILSTTGVQVVEQLSPSHLLSQLHGDALPATTSDSLPQGSPTGPIMDANHTKLIYSSVIVAIIMLLKSHLKMMYGISEDKCSKWVFGKKSALGDRPATRRFERPVSWNRLPFATRPILTDEDIAAQRTTFLEVWNEDGVTAEPEDD